MALVATKGFGCGCWSFPGVVMTHGTIDVLPLEACLPLPLPPVDLPLALALPLPLPLPLPCVRTLSSPTSLSPPESVSTGISDVGVATQHSKICVSLTVDIFTLFVLDKKLPSYSDCSLTPHQQAMASSSMSVSSPESSSSVVPSSTSCNA